MTLYVMSGKEMAVNSYSSHLFIDLYFSSYLLASTYLVWQKDRKKAG